MTQVLQQQAAFLGLSLNRFLSFPSFLQRNLPTWGQDSHQHPRPYSLPTSLVTTARKLIFFLTSSNKSSGRCHIGLVWMMCSSLNQLLWPQGKVYPSNTWAICSSWIQAHPTLEQRVQRGISHGKIKLIARICGKYIK